MSARRLIPLGLLVAVAIGTLTYCKEDASPRAHDAEKWLNKFYGHYDIRGGWGVFGIDAKGHSVNVMLNVPEKQAHDLMNFDVDKRKRFIAYNACPPRNEEVWSTLEEDGDIIIKTRLKGNVFAEASCRNDNMGPPL